MSWAVGRKNRVCEHRSVPSVVAWALGCRYVHRRAKSWLNQPWRLGVYVFCKPGGTGRSAQLRTFQKTCRSRLLRFLCSAHESSEQKAMVLTVDGWARPPIPCEGGTETACRLDTMSSAVLSGWSSPTKKRKIAACSKQQSSTVQNDSKPILVELAKGPQAPGSPSRDTFC